MEFSLLKSLAFLPSGMQQFQPGATGRGAPGLAGLPRGGGHTTTDGHEAALWGKSIAVPRCTGVTVELPACLPFLFWEFSKEGSRGVQKKQGDRKCFHRPFVFVFIVWFWSRVSVFVRFDWLVGRVFVWLVWGF